MERIDSLRRPAEWASAMSKRAEILSLAARELGSREQQKRSPAQRVFGQLSDRLQSLSGLLRELEESVQKKQGFVSLRGQALEEELSAEEKLVQEFTGRSSLYLLMCSPRIIRELQESGKRLRKAVESLSDRQLVGDQEELETFVKPSPEDEALMDSLEDGMLDTIVVDNGLCSKLAKQIASSVGLELFSPGFSQEIQKLRDEKTLAETRGGKVHALYLEQFLLVLDRAVLSANRGSGEEDPLATRRKKETMLNSVSMSGRDAPMLPLQPFICPITRDVMRDPVQIGSGQTYEREAIQRWFADNTRCPVTGEELTSTQVKSNFALKQSIAEWRERNFEARLHGVARSLSEPAGDRPEVQLRLVGEVRSICEQEPLNRYKVGAMGLVAPMVKLLGSRDPEVRKETLASLAVLARDNLENQETMVKEGIIELLVYSLTRQKADLQEAVVLMKILSENPGTAERISHAQGAVVFLVTLLGSGDEALNHNVKAILENVPTSDENVVIMAEASLMRPLANRIVEGSAESRIVMAKALAGMHLPVSSKTSVATDDVIQSLLKMIAATSEVANEAALGALQNLTSVSSIAETVIRLQGFKQLEQKLNLVKTSEAFKIGAARVIADLSTVAGDAWEQEDAALNELEVYIYKFLHLMGSIAPPAVQSSLLQALLRLSSGRSVGEFTVQKLGENNAMQLLLPLLKRSEAPTRKPAMELFCLLSKRFNSDAGAAVKQKPEILSELLKNLSDDPQRIELLSIGASVEDGNELIERIMLEQPSFVNVVTGLVVESQEAPTIEPALKIVLKLARLGGVEAQKQMAEIGLVERLVQLLDPGRTRGTRYGAAWILAEMASHSRSLIASSKKKKKKKNVLSGFVALCLPWLVPRAATRVCKVHKWRCTARGTFCLVEAEGVAPLVALLREAVTWKDEVEGATGALAALATLTSSDRDGEGEGEGGGREGCSAIDKCKGVAAVIAAVSSSGGEARRYALAILDRVFEEAGYCQEYGQSAQMHVIYAAQTGDLKVKRIAGRILRRLDLIHSQSNYFAG